ncbi:hypothetical protein ACMZ52_26615, partial [Klebsiella pneumoniae]|nr:hypothetical protein [Klebsiella michiganensis]MDU3715570.1 hypothetical protein [Klebsiella michiganensis]
ILNFCFATELPASSGLWSSDPSTQQKFDLFNKAEISGNVYGDAIESTVSTRFHFDQNPID